MGSLTMAAAQAIALRFRSWFRSRRTEDGGDTAAVITEAIKIPRGLQGYVAIELLDEQLLIIYVTKEHRHAAEFESLIEWLRSRDYPPPEIRIATLDAVHAMKKRSQTTARTVPAQRKVLAILKAAAARGASDIHFRQYPNNQAGYELRINGRMTAAIEYFTKADLRKLLQALYGITDPNSRSRIGSYLEDQSIDAAIIERLADLHLDDLYSAIRLKFVPAFFGPECAVRLQPRRNTPLTLSTLGLSVRDRDMLLTMLSQPNGAIYISGPVNSGKSQLLIMLGAEHHQRFPWRRIVTIEDPVEAPIPGATQLVFNAANPAEREQEVKSRLRDMVRLDYDLGILGENRDSETAQLF
jgi:type II secretory ATPase GspE/PulE/Tfp pilus assembly ATPase PilB-like protein